MGRKSSDGSSGVGAELLNALKLNKYINSTDDSDLNEKNDNDKNDKNNKGSSRFRKFKMLSKEKKKISNVREPDDMEIDLKNKKDNHEIEQASEKKAVSSLVDIQHNFEAQLEEFEKSMENIKKNINEAESSLEDIYTSVDKLEKFIELCNVENKDVILGLHKLVNVHKGAALLSTFSEDPTFKKNYEYNVNDTQEEKFDKKSNIESSNFNDNISIEIVDSKDQYKNDQNIENVINKQPKSDQRENKVSKENTVKSNISNEDINENISNSENIDEEIKNDSSEQNLPFSNKNNEQVNHKNNNGNREKSQKEGRVSKTEKFKEKLDYLRIRKSKKYQNNEENKDIDVNEDVSSTRHKHMEKLRQKFDRRRHSNN